MYTKYLFEYLKRRGYLGSEGIGLDGKTRLKIS
jgi:hypothetical protein